MQVIALHRPLLAGNGVGGEIVAVRPGQHDAAFPVVLLRIDDVEIGAVPALPPEGENRQIVFAALVGPAPFAVVGGFVGEAGVCGRGEIERRAAVAPGFDFKVDRGAGDLAARRREVEPERVDVVPVGAVVLDQHAELAAEHELAVGEGEPEFRRFPAEQGCR